MTTAQESIQPAATATTQRRTQTSFRLTPYLFLAPALIWYLMFLVYPMYQSLVISFMDWDGLSPGMEFVGLGQLPSHHL